MAAEERWKPLWALLKESLEPKLPDGYHLGLTQDEKLGLHHVMVIRPMSTEGEVQFKIMASRPDRVGVLLEVLHAHGISVPDEVAA